MTESEDLIASRAKERGAASFNVRDLTYFLDNGKQNTERNESIMLQFERDPLFNIKTFNLDLKGQREVSFQRITKLAAYNKKSTISAREIQTAVRLILPGELSKHAVSEGTRAVTKYTSAATA